MTLTIEWKQCLASAQRLLLLGFKVHVIAVLFVGTALAGARQRRVRCAQTTFGTRRATVKRTTILVK